MIDIEGEKLISFCDAARRLPSLRRGKPLNLKTLYRWAQTGRRGVRLESVRVGGTRCTSVEALARFISALSGPPAEVPSARHSKIREKQIEEAEKSCAAAGF